MIRDHKIGREIQGGSTGGAVAGFILAGGNSRRMGRDKALLKLGLGGPSLLEQTARIVSEAVGNVTVIGAPERYGHLGWPVVADVHPGCGPMGGLQTILQISRTDWNLVLACDMPELTVELITDLAKSVLEGSFDCVISQDASGQLHPLCAVYHRRCRPAVERMIFDKCFTLHKLIDNLRVRHWFVADNLLLRNVNSPSDLLNTEKR